MHFHLHFMCEGCYTNDNYIDKDKNHVETCDDNLVYHAETAAHLVQVWQQKSPSVSWDWACSHSHLLQHTPLSSHSQTKKEARQEGWFVGFICNTSNYSSTAVLRMWLMSPEVKFVYACINRLIYLSFHPLGSPGRCACITELHLHLLPLHQIVRFIFFIITIFWEGGLLNELRMK